jgi:hypothetical protein
MAMYVDMSSRSILEKLWVEKKVLIILIKSSLRQLRNSTGALFTLISDCASTYTSCASLPSVSIFSFLEVQIGVNYSTKLLAKYKKSKSNR